MIDRILLFESGRRRKITPLENDIYEWGYDKALYDLAKIIDECPAITAKAAIGILNR